MDYESPQTIIASTGRRLADFAAMQGMALDPLAQSVGIDPADFSRSDLRLSLEAFMRLLQLLAVVSGDDRIGLRFAEYFQQGDSGAFGFALLHAPSLREALRVYETYLGVAADMTYFEVEADKAEVVIRWRYAQMDDPAQYADFHAGLLVKTLRHFLGVGWVPERTALLRRTPRDTRLHRTFFGTAITFEAAGANALVLRPEDLAARSGRDDPRLFEMMEEACRTALSAIERNHDLRLQVARQIAGLLPQGEANLAAVAGLLALGERSLQRRLAEHGTSFEKMVEQTRRDVSDRLLAGDTPLAEISYLCGYSNASAYSRAARGWYGMTPQAMRQHLQRTGSAKAGT